MSDVIGPSSLKLLKPFGCKILVNDPYVQLSEQDRFEGIGQVSLEQRRCGDQKVRRKGKARDDLPRPLISEIGKNI